MKHNLEHNLNINMNKFLIKNKIIIILKFQIQKFPKKNKNMKILNSSNKIKIIKNSLK